MGNRQWALAYHPYPPNLLRAEFSRNDWPKITFGNINRLVAWLMQKYPIGTQGLSDREWH